MSKRGMQKIAVFLQRRTLWKKGWEAGGRKERKKGPRSIYYTIWTIVMNGSLSVPGRHRPACRWYGCNAWSAWWHMWRNSHSYSTTQHACYIAWRLLITKSSQYSIICPMVYFPYGTNCKNNFQDSNIFHQWEKITLGNLMMSCKLYYQ